MNEKHYYLCSNEDTEWEGVLQDIHIYSQFISCTMVGRGSSINAYIGMDERNNWIAFPDLEKASSLSYMGDIFWNSEKIGNVLESIPDGITVAYALKELNAYMVVG